MSYANEIFVSRSSPLEPAQRYVVPASKNLASVHLLLIMLARFLYRVSYFARSRSVSRLTVAAAFVYIASIRLFWVCFLVFGLKHSALR